MLTLLLALNAQAQEAPVPETPAPTEDAAPAEDAPLEEASSEDAPPDEVPAEEAEPEPPKSFSISVDDSDLGSALDDFDDKSARYREEDPDRLDDAAWRGLRPQLFRGRWFIKPVLAWASLQGKAAVPLGIAVGHQWFPASDHPLQISGETRLDLTFPVGAAKGRSLELASTAGPWVGPVGLRFGPVARFDRWESDAALLDDAFAMGLRATAGLDAKYVKPWVGIEPVWLLSGPREAWSAGIGELSYLAGVQYAARMAHFGFAGSMRQTSVGNLYRIAFTVHVRPR
ncbi:MAG: hypothetical protein EP330_14875 [Deltaproteobacteria bacterium]|nr:MAG: hypothetical protein EP330_14875 [Deltaproteobacteria bacterium]